jgi:ribose 5-phosphate isomerase B
LRSQDNKDKNYIGCFGMTGVYKKEDERMNTDREKIIIGSDHAAFQMKETIKSFLHDKGFEVSDQGPECTDSVDYPDFGVKVAALVASKAYERGILMCGTGIGMSMVANRFPHVRAALCGDVFSAAMSRQHNDSNILVMGGRMIGDVLALEIVRVWLETPFDGGRHRRRIDKFDQIDVAQYMNAHLKMK